MFCTKCGENIDDDSQFCPNCGETIDFPVNAEEPSFANINTSVPNESDANANSDTQNTSKPKSNKKFLIIGIIVVVGLLIVCGVLGFLWWQNDQKNSLVIELKDNPSNERMRKS
ncbi:MAG: zinc-ribbon domain-containing protein [Coriobacteriales bacterium]|nr:zinc-ribbon domain-containing protein [Coriobacteriales bacterium]